MISPDLPILIIAGTFFVAGAVKGVIGLGLPTVSLALLAVAIDLPTAMALLLAPSAVTNLWQALAGGPGGPVLRRIWPFLAAAAVTVWPGSMALISIDVKLLSALLGVLLVVYAGTSLAGLRLMLTPRQIAWSGPVAGALNGALTGMTGSFVVPGVLYLKSLGFDKNEFIQAMGMLFTVSTLALALALGGHGLLNAELGLISAAALIPAMLGMMIGARVRRKLTEQGFSRVFFVALLVLGVYVMISALQGV